MKKIRNLALMILFIFGFIVSTANASVIEYVNPDQYTMPDEYQTIASHQPIYLDHYNYGLWRMDDLNLSSSFVNGQTLDIVFKGIHNWAQEPNWLNVYIIDGNYNTDPYDFQAYSDFYNPIDWTEWTQIGVWSDLNGGMYPGVPTYDVVFQLTIDDTWATNLTNGGNFFLGIDPQCAFYNNGIEVNAPAVPEPATLLLIGSGLLGLAGFRNKNNV